MSPRGKIPRPTVKRLSLYLRELESHRDEPRATISSRQLGEALELTDAQVRKDLAYFGQFGHPGIGYQIDELIEAIRRILGTDQRWAAILVGAGNIGRAVARYGRLSDKGFDVIAVFDDDDDVIGTDLGNLEVRSVNDMPRVVQAEGVRIGMLAVPAEAAQDVSDRMVAAGITGILNFAPRRLTIPAGVAIVSVDLTVSLEQLAFKICLGRNERPQSA